MSTHRDLNRPRIHPRLMRRKDEFAALLHLEDATEIEAVLEDLQILLYRCGYHLDLLRQDRVDLRRRRRAKPTSMPARRGRRPGSVNWANRQLGLGLATLWVERGGVPPRRRFDPATGKEYGPYREFVSAVLDALPRQLRATRKGAVPEVDHLVRLSIDEWAGAQASDSEARRRGLLGEERWIAPP